MVKLDLKSSTHSKFKHLTIYVIESLYKFELNSHFAGRMFLKHPKSTDKLKYKNKKKDWKVQTFLTNNINSRVLIWPRNTITNYI